MKTTLQKACAAAGRPLSLLEVAALPVTKADLAHEAQEFREACIRAELKGDKAHELLNAPFRPTPGIQSTDYTAPCAINLF
jgi:hypothetical protein